MKLMSITLVIVARSILKNNKYEVKGMKVGICTAIGNVRKMEEFGFDYIESPVVKTSAMEEKEFTEAVRLVEGSSLRCEAFNVLFPGDIRLTGPDVDPNKIREYLRKAFPRISRLGAKVAVFGSGGARKIPEGWNREEAWKQFVDAAGIVGDVAAAYGLTIAMEPLNRKETNILNSVEEGFRFVQEVNHPNIQLLADFYHMRMENESMNILMKAGPVLRHLHIANSHGRVYPLDPSEDSYPEFFEALKNAGYEGRISIEAGTEDMDREAPIALKLLRKLTA